MNEMPTSASYASIGDRVPLVQMIDLIPVFFRSLKASEGVRHMISNCMSKKSKIWKIYILFFSLHLSYYQERRSIYGGC